MKGMIRQPMRNGIRQHPGRDGFGRDQFAQGKADGRGHENRDLLACGLERGVEALVAGGRNLGKIDRNAAEFDAGGEALQQATDEDDDRRGNADRGIGRTERDGDGADRHDRQGHDQALAAADLVDIGAEHDGADRAHQGAEPEHAEGVEKGGGFIVRRKERGGDVAGIEAEQEEVELLEEIAAGRAENGANSRFDLSRWRTGRWRHYRFLPVSRAISAHFERARFALLGQSATLRRSVSRPLC